MNVSQLLLHCSLIRGIGPAVVQHLMELFPGDQILSICRMSQSDVVHQCRLSPAQAGLLVEGLRNEAMLAREIELLAKHGISWISFVDQSYPELMRSIYLPPIGLYVQGSVACLSQPSVALVGSRQANAYASRVIDRLVPQMVQEGFVCVSGGAVGVDTMVHSRTLEASGSTVAVLGSGLLRAYPAQNRALFARIAERGGAVVSPFALEMSASAGHFPARNRIISALCRATVVVQAAKKSGALITARFALEQGRDVFAVPGPIDDPLSEGTLELIAQGAQIMRSAADLCALYGAQSTSVEQDDPVQEQVAENQPLTVDQQIIDLCHNPQSIDMLMEQMALDPVALAELLFDLQIAGRLEQNFMGLWKRV